MLDLPTASRMMRDAYKSRKQRKMRKANDKIMISSASGFSKPIYKLAVYSYVLSKILSKPRFMGRKYVEKHKEMDRILSELASASSAGDNKTFRSRLKDLDFSIHNVEASDSRFILSMIDKGKLKTAAILYAQGFSLSAAAEMTGIDQQELMDYAGKTRMFDRLEERTPLSKRIKKAQKMLIGDAA